ncbi:putative ribonuclease P complex subunit Pop4 [Morchella snyderi]|nr:putative ribonuclease P complex subunit Pop4 [Morchella snyderi]
MSAPAPATPTTLSLLTLAHSPIAAATIHASKLHRKPLYLHPTPTSTDARAVRQAARLTTTHTTHRKPRPLTAREKRALRIHHLPKSASYATFAPLHDLWVGYMREVLGAGCAGLGQAQIGAKLVSADYHGAVLEVVRSRCVSRVGIKGVCVKETRGMFFLVGEEGVVKEIPKEHTVFRFELPLPEEKPATMAGPATTDTTATAEATPATPAKPRRMVFELHGQQFMYRAAERVGKKFKGKPLADL